MTRSGDAETVLASLPEGRQAAATAVSEGDQTALEIRRLDAAGAEISRHLFRGASKTGFAWRRIAPTADGGFVVGAACSGPLTADATGPAPAAIECESSSSAFVARLDADGRLAFASPLEMPGSNPRLAAVSDDGRGGAIAVTLNADGLTSSVSSFDRTGKRGNLFAGERGVTSTTLFVDGTEVVRAVGVGQTREAWLLGSNFDLERPAIVIARSISSSRGWARLLGPSPGRPTAIAALGKDALVIGTFEGQAVFGADGQAQRHTAAGAADGFVARVAFVADCPSPPPTALPEASVARVCEPSGEEFREVPKPDGSFDWNCDGIEERELDDVNASCSFVSTTSCRGGGWKDEVAPCGAEAPFVTCSGPYCADSVGSRVQRCR